MGQRGGDEWGSKGGEGQCVGGGHLALWFSPTPPYRHPVRLALPVRMRASTRLDKGRHTQPASLPPSPPSSTSASLPSCSPFTQPTLVEQVLSSPPSPQRSYVRSASARRRYQRMPCGVRIGSSGG